MKDILIEIDRLAEEELERANKIHPPFHSDHEGKSIIQEEIEEAFDCLKNIDESYEGLWNAIKEDDAMGAMIRAKEMRESVTWAAAELIQVIAMCDKFVKSQEARMEESNGDRTENH